MAPRDTAAEPIGLVDSDDLARWAEETEPKAGSGVQSIDGQVKLDLVTSSNNTSARELLERLGDAEYSAKVAQLEVEYLVLCKSIQFCKSRGRGSNAG